MNACKQTIKWYKLKNIINLVISYRSQYRPIRQNRAVVVCACHSCWLSMGRVKSGASGSSSRESRSGGDYASGSGSTSSDVKVKGLLNELHHLIHQVQVLQNILSSIRHRGTV